MPVNGMLKSFLSLKYPDMNWQPLQPTLNYLVKKSPRLPALFGVWRTLLCAQVRNSCSISYKTSLMK
ncbi:unknown [Prevotella sp. CAG:891]|nr:unknown [Prevotella sp. CAG:891]